MGAIVDYFARSPLFLFEIIPTPPRIVWYPLDVPIVEPKESTHHEPQNPLDLDPPPPRDPLLHGPRNRRPFLVSRKVATMETTKIFRIVGNLAVVIHAEKVAHAKNVRVRVETAISGPAYQVEVSGQEENVHAWAEEMDADELFSSDQIDHEYYSKWEE